MQPGHLGDQIVPVVVGAEVILLRRPPAVVARQVQDVDLLEVGRQVAVHQGVKLADGEAVLELVAVVGPLAGFVDFAAGVVAVGQHPEHRKMELRCQGVVGPFDHACPRSARPGAGDREVVVFQAADFLGPHDLIVVAVRKVHDDSAR